MPILDAVCQELAKLAPLALAESWDNVGLLVGERSQTVNRVMTCLTISPNVVDEAISEKADLVIAHHPLPFKAIQKLTSDTIPGSMLLKLISGGVAVYSAHTAFDSAQSGINQMWADCFQLTNVQPLIVSPKSSSTTDSQGPVLGAGRVGRLAAQANLIDVVRQASEHVGATSPRFVGSADQQVTKIAFACGSGGSFLSAAKRNGVDALITGEATFHTCLEAESLGIGLGLLGHYWSERFAMERMAQELAELSLGLTIWPSRSEHDPIQGLFQQN